MSALEWVLTVVFVVPIIVGCAAFVVCALWMQEHQRADEKHGLA